LAASDSRLAFAELSFTFVSFETSRRPRQNDLTELCWGATPLTSQLKRTCAGWVKGSSPSTWTKWLRRFASAAVELDVQAALPVSLRGAVVDEPRLSHTALSIVSLRQSVPVALGVARHRQAVQSHALPEFVSGLVCPAQYRS
jgi:hypothetical protein